MLFQKGSVDGSISKVRRFSICCLRQTKGVWFSPFISTSAPTSIGALLILHSLLVVNVAVRRRNLVTARACPNFTLTSPSLRPKANVCSSRQTFVAYSCQSQAGRSRQIPLLLTCSFIRNVVPFWFYRKLRKVICHRPNRTFCTTMGPDRIQ